METGLAKTATAGEELLQQTTEFFGLLATSERGRKLLKEQNHRIQFDLTEGGSFHVDVKGGEVRIVAGSVESRRFDLDDLIHFQLSSATLQKLLRGQIRFTDALVPADPDGNDAMLLMECTLLKWSVLSWVGRMFRTAQLARAQVR